MDFSIVIPLFNKEKEISRAIKSILDQSFNNYEVLIIDDGSTDNSKNIVKNIKDTRIKYIYQINSGASVARNIGVQNSNNNFIAFLDADDAWKPDFLKTIYNLIKKFPTAGAFATAYEIETPNGSRRLPKFHSVPKDGANALLDSYFYSAAFGEPPLCASAVVVPKLVFNNAGGFPAGKRMGEDLDLWGKISLTHKIAFSSTVQAIYYHNANNRACNTFNIGDEHPFIDTYRKFVLENKIFPLNNKKDIDCYISRLLIENARQYVLCGNYKKARNLIAEIHGNDFKIRKFLWGWQGNFITRLAWEIFHFMKK